MNLMAGSYAAWSTACTAGKMPSVFSAGFKDREVKSEKGSSTLLSPIGCEKSIFRIADFGTITIESSAPTAAIDKTITRDKKKNIPNAARHPTRAAAAVFRKSLIYTKF